MARRKLWIKPVKAGMKRRGTVGIFRRKAKSLGVSTRTLARRWRTKAGVWGKRARLALTFGKIRRKGGRRTTRGRRRK